MGGNLWPGGTNLHNNLNMWSLSSVPQFYMTIESEINTNSILCGNDAESVVALSVGWNSPYFPENM